MSSFSESKAYPVFLDLRGKNCMVIGGGRVAERKALSLLSAGGDVKVISPSLTSRLKKERSKGNIKHISRHYRKTDLKSAFLVIAATGSHKSNSKIAEDAKDALLNVVDTPSLCSFIVPSTIIRGPLQIAISTSGLSPAMSKTIRKELEVLYPKSLGRYLNFLRGVREKASREIKDKKKRQRFLKSLASPEAINALRQGFTLKKALALIKPP